MNKKLYRSKENKWLAGVCAGLAQYLNIDETIVRLVWVLVVFFGGTGILAYIICAIVIPEEPGYTQAQWTPAEPEDKTE